MSCVLCGRPDDDPCADCRRAPQDQSAPVTTIYSPPERQLPVFRIAAYATGAGLLIGIIFCVALAIGHRARGHQQAAFAPPVRQNSGDDDQPVADQPSDVTPVTAASRQAGAQSAVAHTLAPALRSEPPPVADKLVSPPTELGTKSGAGSVPDDIPPPPPPVVVPDLSPPGANDAPRPRSADTILSSSQLAASATRLERLRRQQPNDTALLLNLAYIYDRQQEQIRAAKMLQQFLEQHKDADPKVQETLQNAIGTCLARVEKHNDAYEALRRFYQRFDEQLASGRSDGRKRWGQNWIAGAEADQKWQELASAEARLTRAKRQADRDDAGYQRLAEQYNDLIHSHRFADMSLNNPQIARFYNAVQQADSLRARSAQNLKDATDGYEQTDKPPWPSSIPTPQLAGGTP